MHIEHFGILGVVDFFEPEIDTVPLAAVMQALADDVRLEVVRVLAAEGERVCGSIELGVSKATRSHHLRVLREAGITRTRVDGARRHVSLRRADMDSRFPGLLDALLAAASQPSPSSRA
ncbi:MAG: helix-turn-helix transcriptional regulator [Solirubrobacterales bacterium]|nr:helix-turn-helix transcriptional regulator [Solirubrobacterales bacterium]